MANRKNTDQVRVLNKRNGPAYGIPAGKTGVVPRWQAEAYPQHLDLLEGVGGAKVAKPAPLAEIRSQIKESTDLEWLSDRMEDHRPSVQKLAEERLGELASLEEEEEDDDDFQKLSAS